MVYAYAKANHFKTVTGLLNHVRNDLQLAKETNARTGHLDEDEPLQQKTKKDQTMMAMTTEDESTSVPVGGSKCAICDLKEHTAISCNSFTAKERKQKAAERRLCFRCLHLDTMLRTACHDTSARSATMSTPTSSACQVKLQATNPRARLTRNRMNKKRAAQKQTQT